MGILLKVAGQVLAKKKTALAVKAGIAYVIYEYGDKILEWMP